MVVEGDVKGNTVGGDEDDVLVNAVEAMVDGDVDDAVDGRGGGVDAVDVKETSVVGKMKLAPECGQAFSAEIESSFMSVHKEKALFILKKV